MKLLLSTSNVIGESPSFWRLSSSKSNTELVSSLRSHFTENPQNSSNNANHKPEVGEKDYQSWTKRVDDCLEIPALNFSHSALQEERQQYDITAKLFFLPGASVSKRPEQVRKALDLVFQELGMPSIDLLIVSFPGIYFDEEEDSPEKISTRGPVESEPEGLESVLATWKALEPLQEEGLVSKLGIAEFGKDRLENLLENSRIKPSVDQINLRNCCSVPKDLLTLAKTTKVDLLVHNDSSNILPRGTLQDLLGPAPKGVGILADSPQAGDKRKSLHGEAGQANVVGEALQGELQPQWVMKYTAVVRNRGVVENKGYFAVAELKE